MPESYTVAIVGAGPPGLHAATLLAERGWKCVVLEEDSQVGIPENCTGLISDSGVRDLGIDTDGILLNPVHGANIFSPYNERIVVERTKPVAFMVKRCELDKSLAKKAQKKGVEIRTNTKMIDIRKETIFVESNGRGEMLRAQVIIGADGPMSRTRDLIMEKPAENGFIHAYQVRAEGKFDPRRVNVYFTHYAKNFFAWNAPESASVSKVGLGVPLGQNIKQSFDSFVKEKNLESKFSDAQSALIPVGPPLEKSTDKNILLLGDAAFQTKSTTGGGIITGMTAAQAAAKAVHHHLADKKPLAEYDRYLAPLKKDLAIHYKMHKYLGNFSEEQLDKLFIKLKKAGIEEFLNQHGDMDRPSRFVSRLAGKPAFWFLAGYGIKYLMT